MPSMTGGTSLTKRTIALIHRIIGIFPRLEISIAVNLVIIFIIISAAISLMILDIMPFLSVTDTANKGIDISNIFFIACLTALLSIFFAIIITLINFPSHKVYFGLLLVSLVLLFILETSLFDYYGDKFATNSTNNDGDPINSTSNISIYIPFMLNASQIQQLHNVTQGYRRSIGYYQEYYPGYARPYYWIEEEPVTPLKIHPEYFRLGNYSISISGLMPNLVYHYTNIGTIARLSMLDFNQSGNKGTFVVAESEYPLWQNFTSKNSTSKTAMDKNSLNLMGLLASLAELKSGWNLQEVGAVLFVDKPYPGFLVLDTRTGIKGYAGMLSDNDAVLLISAAGDEAFSDLLGGLKVIPIKQEGPKRLEMIRNRSINVRPS